MATRVEKTTNYKQIARLLFIVFLCLLGRCGYLQISSLYLKHDISRIQEKLTKKEAELKTFSEKPGYDKLKYVKTLEQDNKALPWSDHIKAIMAIFWDLLDVDRSDTSNIAFSNFEISLEKIKLDWYVKDLVVLYEWTNSKKGLIARFEELSFLDNISIKTYEKSEWEWWYNFTLTANVINNGK